MWDTKEKDDEGHRDTKANDHPENRPQATNIMMEDCDAPNTLSDSEKHSVDQKKTTAPEEDDDQISDHSSFESCSDDDGSANQPDTESKLQFERKRGKILEQVPQEVKDRFGTVSACLRREESTKGLSEFSQHSNSLTVHVSNFFLLSCFALHLRFILSSLGVIMDQYWY